QIARIGQKTVARRAVARVLSHLDGSAGVLELLLHGGRLVLADVLLHGLGRAIDKVFGLLEAEARELANGLDHIDLRRARFLEDHAELGLLLSLGGSCRAS